MLALLFMSNVITQNQTQLKIMKHNENIEVP